MLAAASQKSDAESSRRSFLRLRLRLIAPASLVSYRPLALIKQDEALLSGMIQHAQRLGERVERAESRLVPRCYTSEGLYRTIPLFVRCHPAQPTRHPKPPNLARGALT